MITGVTNGFTLELELVGVGYRANASGQKLRFISRVSPILLF